MYSFDTAWPQEIADVSGEAEYQTASIQILDVANLIESYDQSTNTYTTAPSLIWSGQARFIGIRTSVPNAAGGDYNPTSIQAGRVQIPYGAYTGRISRDWKVRIVDGGRNPALGDVLYSINNSIQGSSEASITLEISIDVESSAGWS